MINEEYFEKRVGSPPIQDDMVRVNCACVGESGHLQCGWCKKHDKPRFVCGCYLHHKENPMIEPYDPDKNEWQGITNKPPKDIPGVLYGILETLRKISEEHFALGDKVNEVIDVLNDWERPNKN